VDQLTARDLVLVGLVAQAVLALLFALVWRRLRSAWAGWLALGLAANAATYAIMLPINSTRNLTRIKSNNVTWR